MTVLSFDQEGVDVVYEGTEFRMEKALIEEATGAPVSAEPLLDYLEEKFCDL